MWARAVVVALATLIACSAAAPSLAQAAPGDIGFEGPSFGSLGGSPTGSKPESKLWFNDGRWWASMWSEAAGSNLIFALDRGSHTWTATTTALDDRPSSRADVLWDASAGKLYVASHVFVMGTGSATSPANAARLYRYSYDGATKTYVPDPGYPLVINGARSETLVLDKDSTGTLWATWAQDRRIYVTRTIGGVDTAWATPYVLPGPGTLVDSDDISSLVHVGSRVGVMWSNQDDGHVYFSLHPDGADDGSWATEQVPTGLSSDDHINLKADAAGRVYAAIKTSESDDARPLIVLAVRASGGGWSTSTFGTHADDQTRPIVELDEQHGLLHMFATCGNTGGTICHKATSLADPSFAAGPGTIVIADASSDELNDATSTKQDVDSSSGLVVLANNASTNAYWHADLSLGPAPPTPQMAISAITISSHVLAASAATPRVSLRAVAVRRQRALLWGTVRAAGSSARATLQRRDRRGHWLFVRRLQLHRRGVGLQTYALTVRRLSVRSVYRVVVNVPSGGRGASGTLRLAARSRR